MTNTNTNTSALKIKLINLVNEINTTQCIAIKFNQQKIAKQNMSLSGANGRLWIAPFNNQYDICLSGQSLERQMYGFMRELCNGAHDGYKQTKPDQHLPYWRVSNFDLIIQAAFHYAQTKNGSSARIQLGQTE